MLQCQYVPDANEVQVRDLSTELCTMRMNKTGQVQDLSCTICIHMGTMKVIEREGYMRRNFKLV